ncbi:LysE family translocator [Kiloniella laminariae]|uniref:LysE family translocator n=1 Tax=Kiloniella laminariae TaxID=454162 RepID=A0ABT4LKU0_9PROT|nr:LysE family translocator [Kiloniella laminariae]MCZ4281725.1 LysE family translocator [Kiloniella laminariae]
MPSLDTIIAVTIAGLWLSATPGPSMLYVVSRTVGQSRSAGLASAIGLGLGGVILALIAVLGLAVVFQKSSVAYTLLTFAGAGYLTYLGLSMIREAVKGDQRTLSVERIERASFARIVWQGILVEVLNPKTVLFFLAFLPPFIDTSRDDVMMQMLVLGILVPLTAMPSDILMAFAGGWAAGRVNSNPGIKRLFSLSGGLFLIGIAIYLFI